MPHISMDVMCYEADLMCYEVVSIKEEYEDEMIFKDDIILANLLATEKKYQPSGSYFECVQTNIKPAMRKMLAEWMLDVCEEEQCSKNIFPLSMNYVDRFMSVVDIPRKRLQLLGTASMFIASKLHETVPLKAKTLISYTDFSFTLADLMTMELLVLKTLKWEMSAITPQDFLEQILCRTDLEKDQQKLIKKVAQKNIFICVKDSNFMRYLPSIIATGSFGVAAHAVLKSSSQNFLASLYHVMDIDDNESLQSCQEQIEFLEN